MSTAQIEIAAAIAAELNGRSFSRAFTAERLYDPERELEDLETLRVDVILGDVQQTAAARTILQCDYRVDIAVRQRCDPADLAALDALCTFVAELDEFFSLPPRRLVLYPGAIWQASELVYPYLPQHLRQRRQFTSIVRLTYRVFKKPA